VRVFVTGASGFIGSAVVPQLIGAGHQVVGLARSDDSARVIEAAGAEVLRGSLEDLDSLRMGASESDGIIHLAFIHDFANYESSARTDLHAVEAIGAVIEGTARPFLIASGVGTIAEGRPATEHDAARPGFPRTPAAETTLALADSGVRSGVVRLPPTVHGEGDHGFISTLVDIARAKGVSGYVGDGSNRWPAVHRRDAAVLFRKALDDAPAGSVLHAVAEEGVPARTIAEVIGRHLGLPVASISRQAAAEHFGWLEPVFAADLPTTSEVTRKLLDWEPSQPGLVDDLERGHYFA
jgi:nucleoside-diphosphate-sugar epimerase